MSTGDDDPAVREGTEETGTRTLQLNIGGMSCSFCSEAIRKGVGRQAGVSEVHVSLAHEEALVRYRPGETDETEVRDTLRALGFTIRDPDKVERFEEQREEMAREGRRLTVAGAFSGLSFLAMAAMWLDLWALRVWHTWVALAVASFVFFRVGRHIIRMAWGAARRGITNQHVLLTAGALGGYLAGILGTPLPAAGWWGLAGFPAVDFYGVVVFLTTYHLLSAYVSLRVRARASASVRRLMELQPATARIVRNGDEREVPVDEVAEGDRVRVRPGEKVPVDGEVVEGRGAVDESLVTGEPIPSEKGPGDEIIGGSVNRTGSLLVRVTRVGEESFLRRVARHVEEAKALKPGIVALVDRVLKYYVPAVLLISLGAFLFWSAGWGALAGEALWLRAVYAASSVLVMGYPCALGMATPLALIRGGGMAAERGILMRSGEAFQVLKDVEIVVLDKTGTITRGEPRLVSVEPLGGFERETVLRLAAGAESLSEHPLGRAVVDAAGEEDVEVPSAADFESVTGGGVRASVDGRVVLVGKPDLLREDGVDVEAASDFVRTQEEAGRTVVLVAIDGATAGGLAIADPAKADAADAVEALHARGIRTVMLTGDAERTARAVADEVGIEEVRARVLPDQKADRVRTLQSGGRRVAFVGDGINDAPALTQSDVGIAIGAGTDIAIESSDVVLVGERLGAVVDAYHIGHASYRKTVQNLWLAFVFNGVGVPLAATGIVHPVWAMVAMAASVSAVLLNSFGGGLLPEGRGGGRDRNHETELEQPEDRMMHTATAPSRTAILIFLLFLGGVLGPEAARAQEEEACWILCAPEVAFEPTISIENLASRHRTATLQNGVPVDTALAEREAVFEAIVAVGIPTEIPGVELTLEAIWAPFAGTDANPFTGRSAREAGRDEIRDNAVELEGELNVQLVTFEDTGGWLDAHVDVVDQLSPAETPGAAGVYTHKLDLEVDAATAPFARLGAEGWLGGVELEGSLDYMVTGIPDAGDRFGDELFLDDASPWSFSFVLVAPLAPLEP